MELYAGMDLDANHLYSAIYHSVDDVDRDRQTPL